MLESALEIVFRARMSAMNPRESLDTIVDFVDNRESRLEVSVKARAHIRKVLDEHGPESDFGKYAYRIEWLNEVVDELFDFLAEKSEKFESDHPLDAISAADLADVLMTTMARLKYAVALDDEEQEEDPKLS